MSYMSWLAPSASFESDAMGLRPFIYLHCGDRLQTSDSDVNRRQNLTSNVGPRTKKVEWR